MSEIALAILSSQTEVIPPDPDIEAPVITSFTIDETSDSLTVNVLTFTATDNVAVTGYVITETDVEPSTGWVGSAPTTYTFSTEGAKTLYAWAKDSAGNISNYASDTTTITVVEKYPETYSGTIYYVAEDGNDGADGSKSTPFATIDKVNTLTLSGDDAVLFESTGSYEGTITVGQSGTTGHPITFGAYGSTASKPKIYGSEVITGWTLHSGNIWKATFATDIQQLFVDNVRMQAARFPAEGYATVDAAPTTSSLTDAALNGSLDYTGVICLIHSDSYALDRRTVTSSSGTTLQLSSAPFGNVTGGEKYILVGKLEFLTQPGQWFYDDDTNTVYLWKLDGTEPTDTEVRGSTLDYGVYADGKDYVTVKNIEVLQQKKHGVYFTNSDYFTFNNIVSTDVDAVGLRNYLGHNGTIENCIITGANHYGIENYASTGNCLISGNTVSNIALPDNLGLSGIGAWYNGAGIFTQNANTTAYNADQINTIRYNRVDNIGYNGIHFANEAIVEYNYITNCGYTKNDGGFVYTSGGYPPNVGINANSIIRYNIGLYGYGIGSSPYFEGMYADEYSENVTIEYNTVGHSTRGVFFHNGNNNIGRYNTIFSCENGIYVAKDGEAVNLNNNLVYGLSGQEVIHTNIVTGAMSVDYNNYINHYTSNSFFKDFTNYFTFANWKSTTGFDTNSTFDNTALGAGVSERLIINPTNATKTFYLNAATDVINEATNASLTGSFTIAAYSSVIVTGVNLDCILDYEDTEAPVITEFIMPTSTTEAETAIISFVIAGSPTQYLLNESATTPAINDDDWLNEKPTTYTFTSSGTKTLYAWAKDAAGNISTSVSDIIEVTIPNSLLTGLEALYEFESIGTTLLDETDNNLDGTNYQSTTPTTGNPGNAYLYSYATNRYTDFGDNNKFTLSGARTIAVWVNMTSISSNRAICSKVNGSNKEYYLNILTDGSISFGAYENNTTSLVSANTPAGTIVTGNNYLIEVKLDATNRIRTGCEILVNGVSQTLTFGGNVTDLTVGMANTTAPFMIGQNTVEGMFFSGKISQFGIWSKELSTEEDIYLYNDGAGRDKADW